VSFLFSRFCVRSLVVSISVWISATTYAATAAPVEEGPALWASRWQLVQWPGYDMSKGLAGGPVVLEFDREDAGWQLKGHAGCNQFFGPYAVEQPGRLEVGAMNLSNLTCASFLMGFERDYLAMLRTAKQYKVRMPFLEISTTDNQTMKFLALHKENASATLKNVYVGSRYAPCTRVGPTTCLNVRESETEPWTVRRREDIRGFDFIPGMKYQLQVWEEQVNSPPNHPMTRWTLERILSATKI